MLLTYGAFAFGALCMLLGFFIGVRGESAEGGTAVKMFGFEFSASHLGRGLMFSVFGLVLVLVAVFVQPKLPSSGASGAVAANSTGAAAPTQGEAQSVPVPTTAAAAQPASAPAVQGSAAPAPAASSPSSSPDSDEADAQALLRSTGRATPASPAEPMNHAQVAALIQDTLTRMASGECPAANLEPITLMQCNQALASGIQQRLVVAGPITGVRYFGPIATAVGPADQYLVAHQNVTLLWKATTSPNHKLSGLWNGPP